MATTSKQYDLHYYINNYQEEKIISHIADGVNAILTMNDIILKHMEQHDICSMELYERTGSASSYKSKLILVLKDGQLSRR